jgi:hypothetical protein
MHHVIIHQSCTTSPPHQLINYMSQYVAQPHDECMAPRHTTNMPLTIHHKIYKWSSHMFHPCNTIELSQDNKYNAAITPLDKCQEHASMDQ